MRQLQPGVPLSPAVLGALPWSPSSAVSIVQTRPRFMAPRFVGHCIVAGLCFTLPPATALPGSISVFPACSTVDTTGLTPSSSPSCPCPTDQDFHLFPQQQISFAIISSWVSTAGIHPALPQPASGQTGRSAALGAPGSRCAALPASTPAAPFAAQQEEEEEEEPERCTAVATLPGAITHRAALVHGSGTMLEHRSPTHRLPPPAGRGLGCCRCGACPGRSGETGDVTNCFVLGKQPLR